MICLSRGESVSWMRERLPQATPFEVGSNLPQFGVVGFGVETFSLPADSGRKVFVARALCGLFDVDATVLAYIQNWSIFPSSGHLPLLNRFRESLGERRPIDEVPGHLFSAGERPDLVSVITLAVEFFWDCLLLGDRAGVACYVSHDAYIDVLSPDPAVLKRVRETIAPRPPQ